MTRKKDNLQSFAKRIETRVKEGLGGGTDAMERLICRHLTSSENPQVSAKLAEKWVEWRYGKATETHEHKVSVELSIGDADRIIAGYFIAASGGQNQVGQGNPGQAQEQDTKLLPGEWAS